MGFWVPRTYPRNSTQRSKTRVESTVPHSLSSLNSEPSRSIGSNSTSFCRIPGSGRFWSSRREFLKCSASRLCSCKMWSYNFCKSSCNTSAKGRFEPPKAVRGVVMALKSHSAFHTRARASSGKQKKFQGHTKKVKKNINLQVWGR